MCAVEELLFSVAQKHCPIYFFDSNERYYPLDVDTYLAGCQLVYFSREDQSSVVVKRGLLTTTNLTQLAEVYSAAHPGSIPPTDLKRAKHHWQLQPSKP